MTKTWRVVFDTTIFVSASLSRSPTSPTHELLQRWYDDQFKLVTSDILLDELIDKLIEKNVKEHQIALLFGKLAYLAERIEVPPDAVLPYIPTDPDDDHVIACAVVGKADYLVSYDRHLLSLGETFQGIKIAQALPFLWALRQHRGES